MPRPRENNPLGVSDNPVCVDDPVRLAELIAEFERRASAVAENHRHASRAFAMRPDFNSSLRLLARARAGKANGKDVPRTRLSPDLEVLINHKAGIPAAERGSPKIGADDVAQAVDDVLSKFKPRRGSPRRHIERYLVETLMALFQETCGRPIVVVRERDGVYDPGGSDRLSSQFIEVVRSIEPSLSVTTVVNMIRSIRRQYAGKPMRFLDLFPLYGGRIDSSTGKLTPAPGYEVEHLAWSHPIYCPNDKAA